MHTIAQTHSLEGVSLCTNIREFVHVCKLWPSLPTGNHAQEAPFKPRGLELKALSHHLHVGEVWAQTKTLL